MSHKVETGFIITRALAHLYPQHVKAHHINWAWAAMPEDSANGTKPPPEYSEREKKQLALAERWNPFGTVSAHLLYLSKLK